MDERRRSARLPASLPVWLKDARGGERTRTLDVSAHGVAVRTDRVRPLRQYVELEVTLPNEERLALTAMVARAGEVRTGLDFFTLDAASRSRWHGVLAELRRAPPEAPRPPPPEAPHALPPEAPRSLPEGAPSAVPPPLPETPTFLVKPRDLGRLWAFYRGELARSALRLESPIPREPDDDVEVLVVHPVTEKEWCFHGRVLSVQPGRSGRPLLDVALVGVGTADRAAFRAFVSTGLIDEEPVELSDFADDEERLPSVMVDLDDLDPPSPRGAPAPHLAQDFGSDGSEETTVVADPPVDPSLPPVPASSAPTRVPEDEPEAEEVPELDADELVELESGPDDTVAEDEEGALASAARGLEELPPELPEAGAEAPGGPSLGNAAPPREGSAAFVDVPPTSLFASFFAEAAAAVSHPAPDPAEDRADPPRDAPTPRPALVSDPVGPTPPRGSSVPRAGGLRVLPHRSASRLERDQQAMDAAPPPPAAPARGPARVRPSGPGSVVVTAAPPARVVLGDKDPSGGLRAVEAPPATPGSFFELEEGPEREAASDPPPAPAALPDPPRARRRAADERGTAGRHQPMSTAGTNPGLDRDIALARARLIRNPDEPAAALDLAELLRERGRPETLEEACRAYEKVLALRPGDGRALAGLVALHARTGRYDAARARLEEAERAGAPVDGDLAALVRRATRGSTIGG